MCFMTSDSRFPVFAFVLQADDLSTSWVPEKLQACMLPYTVYNRSSEISTVSVYVYTYSHCIGLYTKKKSPRIEGLRMRSIVRSTHNIFTPLPLSLLLILMLRLLLPVLYFPFQFQFSSYPSTSLELLLSLYIIAIDSILSCLHYIHTHIHHVLWFTQKILVRCVQSMKRMMNVCPGFVSS